MVNIALGTTPTILINLNTVSPENFVIADLTIKKGRDIVLTRNIDTASIEDSQISWKLTQKETLKLTTIASYKIMCNWVTADGTRGITKETDLRVIDNHENWELYPGDAEPDDDIVIPVAPVENVTGVVTPQMYGAVADAYTDDSDAIQQAINSGKTVYFPPGYYLIANTIVIHNKAFWNMYAKDAIFEYTGTDFAFQIGMARHCEIEIGDIRAYSGGGVLFLGDSEERWNQYVALKFSCIASETDCIRAVTSGEGWANENYVFGGRFLAGENGVHLVRQSGEHGLNGWKFYNCGIEGVTNGFLFDAGDGEICNNVIINPRYGESFETILKTVGIVVDCKWTAPSPILPSFIVASADTTRFVIDAPIGTYWHMHDTAFIRGAIMNGTLMGERPTLIEVTS